MTTTPNLGITLLTVNQTGKETTANSAIQALENALTATLTLTVSSNTTLTTSQALGCAFMTLNVTGTYDLTVPVNKKEWAVTNTGSGTVTVKTSAGTGIALAAGETRILYCDGTNVIALTQATSGSSSSVYDVGGALMGKPTSSQTIFSMVVVRAFSFPSSMTSSRAIAQIAATGSTTFSLKKNGTQFGTFVFSASGTTASFTGTATSFASGDRFTVVAPSTVDASLADIDFMFAGTRS